MAWNLSIFAKMKIVKFSFNFVCFCRDAVQAGEPMTAKGEVALGFDATCQVGGALISSSSKYSRRRHPRFQFVHLSLFDK
jgi:hypothetical protein